MITEPYNEYLLVMPDGDIKGFNDLETTKAYINVYYEKRIDNDMKEDDYNDITEIGGGDERENICINMGVREGKCEVYKTSDFIDSLEKKLVFNSEKEEVIDKLVQKHINLNINDYNLDAFLTNIESIDMMERYGDRN